MSVSDFFELCLAAFLPKKKKKLNYYTVIILIADDDDDDDVEPGLLCTAIFYFLFFFYFKFSNCFSIATKRKTDNKGGWSDLISILIFHNQDFLFIHDCGTITRVPSCFDLFIDHSGACMVKLGVWCS